MSKSKTGQEKPAKGGRREKGEVLRRAQPSAVATGMWKRQGNRIYDRRAARDIEAEIMFTDGSRGLIIPEWKW